MTTTWKNDEATDAQISFLTKLAGERTGGEAVQARLEMVDEYPVLKGEASELISVLKSSDFAGPAPKPTGTKYDEPVIGKGYFTVTDEDQGHRTFRVSPAQSWCDGKTVIALLTGPNNVWSYTGVGFVTSEGVQVWAKAKKTFPDVEHWTDRLVADVTGAAQLTIEMAKQHVLTSENCFVCGKLLTDPESIDRGIGPVCWDGINSYTH